jgi:hypothetical protein
LPGNVFLDSERDGYDAAVLLHELEHIGTLLQPIGPLWTVVGLRLHDLGNQSRKLINDSADSHEQIRAIYEELHFSRLILEMLELLTPVLEGLALVCEMELPAMEGSYAWSLALSCELAYVRHSWVMEQAERELEFQDSIEFREATIRELTEVIAHQIARARQQRLDASYVAQIFLSGFSDPAASLPYFYGYLYLARLEQSWRASGWTGSLAEFFSAASSWINSVIPLSVLRLMGHEADAKTRSLIPNAVAFLLKEAMALSPAQVNRLGTSGQPLVWQKDDLTPLFNSEQWAKVGQVGVVGLITSNILGSMKDFDEYVRPIEEAKLLLPLSMTEVFPLALDVEQQIVAVAVKERIKKFKDGQIGFDKSGVTWFQFPNQEEFSAFQGWLRENSLNLPDLKLGIGRLKVKVPSILLSCQLITLYTTRLLANNPMFFSIRVLHWGNQRSIYVSENPEEAQGVEKQFLTRAYITDTLLSGIRRVLLPESEELLDHAEIKELTEEYQLGKLLWRKIQNDFPRDRAARVRAGAAAWFRKTLFPAIQESQADESERQKFNFLGARLNLEDSMRLRRWIQHGLVFSGGREFAAVQHPEGPEVVREAVERIRVVAEKTLGIPLVRWNAVSSTVRLDLLPTAQR